MLINMDILHFIKSAPIPHCDLAEKLKLNQTILALVYIFSSGMPTMSRQEQDQDDEVAGSLEHVKVDETTTVGKNDKEKNMKVSALTDNEAQLKASTSHPASHSF